MSESTEKPNCCSYPAQILEGLGKFGIGLAAFIGVLKAPGVAEKIYQIQLAQNQTQSQHTTVIVGSKEVKQDFERIIEKVGIETPQKVIESIPETPPVEKGSLKGIYILPAYRTAVVQELEHADTKAQKEQVIKDYFKRSLQMSNGSTTLELNH